MIIKASKWLQMSDRQKFYLLAGIFFRTTAEEKGNVEVFIEFI
jgi:hypothetical protein